MSLDLRNRSCTYTLLFGQHVALLTVAELLSRWQVADAYLLPADLRTIVTMNFIHDLIVHFCTFHQEPLRFGLQILARDRTAKEGFEEGVIGDRN